MDWTLLVILLFVTVMVSTVTSSVRRASIVRCASRRGQRGRTGGAIYGKAEKLEQRVRVLERIATDRGADLAQQIEDLRREEEGKERIQ